MPTPGPTPGPTRVYPGQRLGLPEHGPGSVASWLLRITAIVIDWAASWAVAVAITGGKAWTTNGGSFVTTGVFIAELTLLTALVGGSFGQLLLRIRVAGLKGRPVSLLEALLRSVLIALVIPPLVFNRDNRGLHDLAVGTVAVRR
ncbi:MAG: RDD family protein [Nocardioidaceae bacterium]|nr:MAG: RDD family protein [Nocardioidaceae bacterium]